MVAVVIVIVIVTISCALLVCWMLVVGSRLLTVGYWDWKFLFWEFRGWDWIGTGLGG
jgi:hypothetical protein